MFGNVHKFCIFIDTTIKLHCKTKYLLSVALQCKFSKAKLRVNKQPCRPNQTTEMGNL